MHAMPSRMETNAPAVHGRFRHRVKGGRAWRPHGVSSAQRNVHRCGPFHCVRHGTCRVHLESIAGTYTGRYAQALSVPHAELDERGEVVPHGRPMPSTPPLALSYAVKLSGSNRARFWYCTSYFLGGHLLRRVAPLARAQCLSLVLTPDFGMSVPIIRVR